MDIEKLTESLGPEFQDGPGPNFDLIYNQGPKSDPSAKPSDPFDWGGAPGDACSQQDIYNFLLKYGKRFGGEMNILGLQVEKLNSSGVQGVQNGEDVRDNWPTLNQGQLRWSAHVECLDHSAPKRYLVKHIITAFDAMPNTIGDAKNFFGVLIPTLNVTEALNLDSAPFWVS